MSLFTINGVSDIQQCHIRFHFQAFVKPETPLAKLLDPDR